MIHLVIDLQTNLVCGNAPPSLWNAALNSPPKGQYKYYARPKVTFVTDLAFLLNFGILPSLTTEQNALHHRL